MFRVAIPGDSTDDVPVHEAVSVAPSTRFNNSGWPEFLISAVLVVFE
jgi:hypothetical protein